MYKPESVEKQQLSDHVVVSVAKWADDLYEVGVLFKLFPDHRKTGWEFDYALFPDGIVYVKSPMEVYDIIEQQIKPHFAAWI